MSATRNETELFRTTKPLEVGRLERVVPTVTMARRRSTGRAVPLCTSIPAARATRSRPMASGRHPLWASCGATRATWPTRPSSRSLPCS